MFASGQILKFKTFDCACSVLMLEVFAVIGGVCGYPERIRVRRNDWNVVER